MWTSHSSLCQTTLLMHWAQTSRPLRRNQGAARIRSVAPWVTHYEKEPAVLCCLMQSVSVSSQRPECQPCSEYQSIVTLWWFKLTLCYRVSACDLLNSFHQHHHTGHILNIKWKRVKLIHCRKFQPTETAKFQVKLIIHSKNSKFE